MSPTVRATPFIYRPNCHAFTESNYIDKQRTYSEIICYNYMELVIRKIFIKQFYNIIFSDCLPK